MSAAVDADFAVPRACAYPLLAHADPTRVVAWRDGLPVAAADFLADVRLIVDVLPPGGHAINLCVDRYSFIASFCAVAIRGQTTLLPPSRARQAIDQALASHADAYVLSDVALDPAPERMIVLPALRSRASAAVLDVPMIDGAHVVAIGFTSGSSGQPKANTKSWGNFRIGAQLNVNLLAEAMCLGAGDVASVVATVPAQHMYGIEMSVVLPLFGPFAVHSGKPFFPADIARALAEVPAPRLLVTTPVHLRTLLREDIELPPIAAIASATAPLSAELAAQAESRYGAPLLELFGSTETCVIAHRRTATHSEWQLYQGVEMRPQPDGTLISAAHLSKTVHLQDVTELGTDGHFRLCGRGADLIEIAGKRASLADLTRRVLALPGVTDGVVLQLDATETGGVQRIAALAVAPGRSATDLLAELREQVDPVFLPRPLRCVEHLPRNETGKLPRAVLLAALDDRVHATGEVALRKR